MMALRVWLPATITAGERHYIEKGSSGDKNITAQYRVEICSETFNILDVNLHEDLIQMNKCCKPFIHSVNNDVIYDITVDKLALKMCQNKKSH